VWGQKRRHSTNAIDYGHKHSHFHANHFLLEMLKQLSAGDNSHYLMGVGDYGSTLLTWYYGTIARTVSAER